MHLHRLQQKLLIPTEVEVDLVFGDAGLASVSPGHRVRQSAERVGRPLWLLSGWEIEVGVLAQSVYETCEPRVRE